MTFEEAAEENGRICVGGVTYTVESGTVLFTVENEPGAALPDAGGSGTAMIHLLGLMLTAAGCLAMAVKKGLVNLKMKS